jgi:lactate dehydrogenase-like 2-hydroxyacid dehydrogenase
MSRPDVLVIGPYPPWDMEALEARFQVHKLWEADDKQAFIAAHAKNIKAIATRGELGADAELISALPHLEIISCYGVGTDAIDLAAARARGIKVTNTPDVLTEDVADIAIGLMLCVARQMLKAEAHVRSGNWRKGNMPLVTRVYGMRLGIIGLGRIGAAVAKRAAAFDMKISYFNRHARSDAAYAYQPSLVELAKASDFLVATVAGGAGTMKLIGAEVFEALGPRGFFINVARGSVVDETALIAALQNNKIAGAGLDVFLNEPNIDERFLRMENAVLQPHHGSGTIETRKAMGKLVRDNLAACFAGQPLLTEVK